eukprot:scaffold25779_cov34-Isochrysis_galbana.AAC.1
MTSTFYHTHPSSYFGALALFGGRCPGQQCPWPKMTSTSFQTRPSSVFLHACPVHTCRSPPFTRLA